MSTSLDLLTVEEIKRMIRDGEITESYVRSYYSNEWWDETP